MDWQAIVIDSGLLEAVLGFAALVVAFYAKKALAKWAEAIEKNDALKIADTLVKAALQKYGGDAKKQMKQYAMEQMLKAFPNLGVETADGYIEAAVLKLKQGMAT